MLFSVKYISQNIEDFQAILNYFFQQLGTNTHAIFSDNLFPDNQRNKLHKRQNLANEYKKLVDGFISIHKLYISKTFSAVKRAKLLSDFIESNEIEAICNDVSKNPFHYDDMDQRLKKIAVAFISFYDDYFIDIVNKDQHFFDFGFENGKICPVCGLETSYQYDHFIPKGTKTPIYPFSSVNSKNLLPICQSCNGPKSSKLILYHNNNRANRRLLAFAPYSDFETWEYLNFELINISKPEVNSPGRWKVSFTLRDGLGQDKLSKIECWKTFYNIEDRFSKEVEKCIKTWMLEFKSTGKSLEEIIADTTPNRNKIRRINGIILQNLLYKYVLANQEIMNLFISETNTAEDPALLLQQQENNQ